MLIYVYQHQEPMSPWITKGLLKSINKKNKLYKQYLNSPSKKGLQKFKTYKNKLNMIIRKAKRKYFFLKFERSKNNMKQTWNSINNILGRGKRQSITTTNLKMIMERFLLTQKTYIKSI